MYRNTSELFRAGKVSHIEIGADEEQVRKILGEPHVTAEEQGGRVWYYYEDAVRERLQEYAHEASANVQEEFGDTVYEEIRVVFDAAGTVSEVWLDKQHIFSPTDAYATVEKTADKAEIAAPEVFEKEDGTMILAEGYEHVVYSVRYEDGSFYRTRVAELKGAMTDQTLDKGKKTFTLDWQDRFGEYSLTERSRCRVG